VARKPALCAEGNAAQAAYTPLWWKTFWFLVQSIVSISH